MTKEDPEYRCSYNSITYFPFVQGVSLFSQLEDVYFKFSTKKRHHIKEL